MLGRGNGESSIPRRSSSIGVLRSVSAWATSGMVVTFSAGAGVSCSAIVLGFTSYSSAIVGPISISVTIVSVVGCGSSAAMTISVGRCCCGVGNAGATGG